MNRSLFFLFASLLLIALALHGKAQGPDQREYLSGEEAKEVKTFSALFLQRLLESKDISRHRNLFVAPFKKRILDNDWLPESPVQLDTNERFQYSISILNLSYFGILYSSGSDALAQDLKPENIYPANVIKIFKKAGMFNENPEVKTTSLAEIRKMQAATKRAEIEYRKYLNHHRAWKAGYERSLTVFAKDVAERSFTYLCKENECGGLPENTRVIEATAFPFDLVLVKRRGELKILKIRFISR